MLNSVAQYTPQKIQRADDTFVVQGIEQGHPPARGMDKPCIPQDLKMAGNCRLREFELLGYFGNIAGLFSKRV